MCIKMFIAMVNISLWQFVVTNYDYYEKYLLSESKAKNFFYEKKILLRIKKDIKNMFMKNAYSGLALTLN